MKFTFSLYFYNLYKFFTFSFSSLNLQPLDCSYAVESYGQGDIEKWLKKRNLRYYY